MIINFDPEFENAAKILSETHFCASREGALQFVDKDVSGIVVRLGTNLDRKFLERFRRLNFVATITTGLDHIDLDYCKEKQIEVISLKGETDFLNNIYATSEHTWALILSLIRKIPWGFDSVRDGEWRRREYFGSELQGKTIGIVGFGRVGKKVAQYAEAFGMTVKIYDPSESVRSTSTLTELLAQSDIVSLHVPLNPETEEFLGIEQLKSMNPSSFLINTSRGKLIKEPDLLEALERGIIAGAAIDVISSEQKKGVLSADHPLIKYAREHGNLLISPHIAGSTHESMELTAEFIAQKIRKSLDRQKVG